MTQLQLLTDLPVVWPVIAVVAATSTAWWLASRETSDLASPARWLLRACGRPRWR